MSNLNYAWKTEILNCLLKSRIHFPLLSVSKGSKYAFSICAILVSFKTQNKSKTKQINFSLLFIFVSNLVKERCLNMSVKLGHMSSCRVNKISDILRNCDERGNLDPGRANIVSNLKCFLFLTTALHS